MLPEKIPLLEVAIDGRASGQLIKRSTYEFRYADPSSDKACVALLMAAGRHHSRAYPTTEELLGFGRKVCEVGQPASVLSRIASAMEEVLAEAGGDERIPKDLLAGMRAVWQGGLAYAGRF